MRINSQMTYMYIVEMLLVTGNSFQIDYRLQSYWKNFNRKSKICMESFGASILLRKGEWECILAAAVKKNQIEYIETARVMKKMQIFQSDLQLSYVTPHPSIIFTNSIWIGKLLNVAHHWKSNLIGNLAIWLIKKNITYFCFHSFIRCGTSSLSTANKAFSIQEIIEILSHFLSRHSICIIFSAALCVLQHRLLQNKLLVCQWVLQYLHSLLKMHG